MKHSIKITSLFILLIIFFSNNCVSQTNKKDKTNKINYKIMEYNKLTSFISGQMPIISDASCPISWSKQSG